MNIKAFILLSCLFYSTRSSCDCPIIIVHKGVAEYVQDCLQQISQTNPNNIIFISDSIENIPLDVRNKILYVPISSYSQSADEFAKTYTHLASNNYNYELFCIQRWFIINDFLKKNKIEQCFACDSDVMIFDNIDQESKAFEPYDIVLQLIMYNGFSSINGHEASGGTSFWKKTSMNKLIEFITKFYTDQSNINHWKKLWKNRPSHQSSHGLCDMTLINQFIHSNICQDLTIKNILEIINDEKFDHHLSCDEKIFLMENGKKSITWLNGFPHAKKANSNKLIKLKDLHFQGATKIFTKEFLEKFQAIKKRS